MSTVRQTASYMRWFGRLRDERAKDRIDIRIRRLSIGNPGDVKPVGGGVSELRIDYGPGYRVYFSRHRGDIILLLCGGDKRDQESNIAEAKKLVRLWSEEI